MHQSHRASIYFNHHFITHLLILAPPIFHSLNFVSNINQTSIIQQHTRAANFLPNKLLSHYCNNVTATKLFHTTMQTLAALVMATKLRNDQEKI